MSYYKQIQTNLLDPFGNNALLEIDLVKTTKIFFLANSLWMLFNVHFFVFADIPSSTLFQSQYVEKKSFTSRSREQGVIHSDARGIWTTESGTRFLSDQTKIQFTFMDSISKAFGHRQVSNTLESGFLLQMENKISSHNILNTAIQSTLTSQDIERFSVEQLSNRFRHRTYSLTQFWKHILFENIHIEAFAGFANCRQTEERKNRFLPFGGIRLQNFFSWGQTMFEIKQIVDGGGSLTSVYGSQILRQLKFSGDLSLLKGLQLHWGCAYSFTYGSFCHEDLMRKTSVLVTDIYLDYNVTSTLHASVGFVHRKLWEDNQQYHGVTGPMGTASISYNIF